MLLMLLNTHTSIIGFISLAASQMIYYNIGLIKQVERKLNKRLINQKNKRKRNKKKKKKRSNKRNKKRKKKRNKKRNKIKMIFSVMTTNQLHQNHKLKNHKLKKTRNQKQLLNRLSYSKSRFMNKKPILMIQPKRFYKLNLMVSSGTIIQVKLILHMVCKNSNQDALLKMTKSLLMISLILFNNGQKFNLLT